MLQLEISASIRKAFGKGAARTLRTKGQTPAVIYGRKSEPLALQLETRPLTKALLGVHRQNYVINLNIDDGESTSTRSVITKEIQTDPVTDTIVHADFYEIALESPMTFTVPVKITGKAKGVDMGGELQVGLTKIILRGKALDIPDFVEIDVTGLMLGDSLTSKEISIPAGVALMSDGDAVLVSVVDALVVA
jgi:large subunit ribosomal protein L25